MAFFIRWESQGDPAIKGSVGAVKFRSEAFSCLLGVGLFALVWVVLGLLFEERTAVHPGADRLGRMLIWTAGILITIGMITKLLFVTPAELAAVRHRPSRCARSGCGLHDRHGGCSARAGSAAGRLRSVATRRRRARSVSCGATKTQLFMLVAGAAWLVGMLLAFRLHTIQANTGNGEEFQYIIAAVVGGTLLTGGYGTALGGLLGACIVAMATLGITFARWNSDWRYLFLGVTLLLAMLANRWIRTKAEGMRR
jgi:hypothetical protein